MVKYIIEFQNLYAVIPYSHCMVTPLVRGPVVHHHGSGRKNDPYDTHFLGGGLIEDTLSFHLTIYKLNFHYFSLISGFLKVEKSSFLGNPQIGKWAPWENRFSADHLGGVGMCRDHHISMKYVVKTCIRDVG